jgi:hypothetical protein
MPRSASTPSYDFRRSRTTIALDTDGDDMRTKHREELVAIATGFRELRATGFRASGFGLRRRQGDAVPALPRPLVGEDVDDYIRRR